MSCRDDIIAFLQEGQKPASDMLQLPYNRNTIQGYLRLMVEGGEIYRFGAGRKSTYSLDNVQPLFPSKKERQIKLPDLPPIMLEWGGYTDKIPDPKLGYIVYGEF